jgi:hypothetical protein
MDNTDYSGILRKVTRKQRVGQHIQAFMWDIQQELSSLVEGDIPDRLLTYAVVQGLTSSILKAMPLPAEVGGPWTQERLLWFADHLEEYLPASDPHWGERPVLDHHRPNFLIRIENEDHIPIFCYRCGVKGHEAAGCTNRRLNYLRPRASQARNKRKYRKNKHCKNKNKNHKNKKVK